jgi:succinate dehydrogenase / fumarate reductase flavoprotein subunit|uniref:FAD-dependent oxidoreductase n=1 Tax=candidate division WOR-3 bacterium TaxID=2052148 RepID=A0A7V3UZR6_UNCW3
MYPESMQESIRKLEATRQERIRQGKIPLLDADAKKALLKSFHPDYIETSMRALQVGPNQGDRTPHELADILEAWPLVAPDRFDPNHPKFEVDVLVIGGGGAGVAAALTAQEQGARVLLATKLRLGDANTMMAQGGIQAADKENDSPERHYLDVLGGGHFKNIPELARALVTDAPAIIAWLEELGVMFDKQPDGTMITIHGGGTSRKRMHACRDYTGAEIMRTLRDEFRNRQIPVLEFCAAVELLTDDTGACSGAAFVNLDTNELFTVRAKTVILTTGGCGRLHIQGFPCTNHYGATADGLVLAYRAGARLVFIDTIQYHPTGVAYPEQIVGQLITEKVRGLGAHLVNVHGQRFIYELESRDITASAIIRECTERKNGVLTPTGRLGVWLDTPLIEILKGEGAVKKNLPAMYHQFARFGIYMDKEPILTYPTQHYQNGGVLINDQGETQVKNLYAAGEVAGGIHGRNRLMGNSLLDILVFGRRAGRAAAEKSKNITLDRPAGFKHLTRFQEQLKAARIPKDRRAPLLFPEYRRPELQTPFVFAG